MPNLRSKKFVVNGVGVKMRICASCLKRMRLETNAA
ncbi:MAG: hypothetical protein UX73_C0018G0003 [candidate division WWE3 bacterium GW2011_GWC1_47_10]|uniref:50S ribosomal protein L28 n=1 Tax=candidate division WWE3 bacterium GW2011_GWC1_47_10 TaxID=1619122 RepID=A0A0G1R0I8_UNCKA|nr:MAG: hypothetical protein UX73_C0018G0003 [candidate division WWE3 bacterium GW2011_GWC1_47_10]